MFIHAAVDCGELSSPENGQVLMFEGTELGASAVYNCDEGYLLLGTTVRQCEASGEWSMAAPTCTCEFIIITAVCSYVHTHFSLYVKSGIMDFIIMKNVHYEFFSCGVYKVGQPFEWSSNSGRCDSWLHCNILL